MDAWRVMCVALAASLVLIGCDRKADESSDEEEPSARADASQETNGDEASAEEKADEEASTEEKADEEGGDQEVDPPSPKPLEELDSALLEPEEADDEAPETFRARFETTKGEFVIEFRREWAPHGVDRAYNLIETGYYDAAPFFRVVDGFMAQFGIHAHPKVSKAWQEATIEADSVEESNTRGRVSFGQSANPETGKSDPSTRTTHLFVNYGDNSSLDEQGFAPVGEVVEGMETVEKLHSGYGGGPPRGPDQEKALEEGHEYFAENFPRLDYIERVEIIDE